MTAALIGLAKSSLSLSLFSLSLSLQEDRLEFVESMIPELTQYYKQ